MLGAFERYAPFVQEYIYRNRWENLRAIQVAAPMQSSTRMKMCS